MSRRILTVFSLFLYTHSISAMQKTIQPPTRKTVSFNDIVTVYEVDRYINKDPIPDLKKKNRTQYIEFYIEFLRNLAPEQAIDLSYSQFGDWAQVKRDNNLPITLQQPIYINPKKTPALSQYAMHSSMFIWALICYFLLYNNIEQAAQK